MKIIFLDIDGVISNEESKYTLNRKKMDLLGDIIEQTDAKIVISSSWRLYSVDSTKKYLTRISHFVPFPFPYVNDIIGVTERISIHGENGNIHAPRGFEIKAWIEDYNTGNPYNKIENYVILDDDDFDMLICQQEHLVRTDGIEGLTEDDVKKAVKILNNVENQ